VLEKSWAMLRAFVTLRALGLSSFDQTEALVKMR
jgi:hypothetical protein